ncbi:unnamed protein product [Vicia faba]|uniref:Uncharacterized protein n=1 Tax=Vicia faba TaxID=3906 RepID=A0AAV0YSP6_VICFA|nr:unnamed protein product [Vicia faba]
MTNVNNINHLRDQRMNMNFYKSKGGDTNKGKKVPMKKIIFEKDIRGLQGLNIDNENSQKKERPNKMSQHLTHDSESSHEHCVIKGKANGKDGDTHNFEQPTEVQKEKLEKNSGYGILSSHKFRGVIN